MGEEEKDEMRIGKEILFFFFKLKNGKKENP